MAVIGGKLYRNHPKNLNYVHKDIKYLVSVIITLGKDISGGDTVFNLNGLLHIFEYGE